MFRKRRRPVLDRETSLRCVPEVNDGVVEETDEHGNPCLVVRRRRAWWIWLVSVVFYVPETKRIALDDIGGCVWRMIDGKRTVRRMIEVFAKEKKLNKKEAEVSISAFLEMLMKRGLINIVVPGPKPRAKKG